MQGVQGELLPAGAWGSAPHLPISQSPNQPISQSANEANLFPAAAEETDEKAAAGNHDVAEHGEPEDLDGGAEGVGAEEGGHPKDQGGAADPEDDEAGVTGAFERAAEDDVEDVEEGPGEEDGDEVAAKGDVALRPPMTRRQRRT